MSCKILVVDDEPAICRLFADLLTEMGYEVSTATGGRQALAKVQDNPNILFLDIRMPEMDGLECLRQIRRTRRKLLVVMMTGYGDVKSAQKALQLGADEYISKPFDLDELKHLVNELVGELVGTV